MTKLIKNEERKPEMCKHVLSDDKKKWSCAEGREKILEILLFYRQAHFNAGHRCLVHWLS